MLSSMRPVAPLRLALTLTACALACSTQRHESPRRAPAVDSAPPADGVAMGYSSSGARFVRNIIGFQGPESVRYDPEQDVFFVSNMTGYGSALDGNGYISRVSAANPDSAGVFAQGGTNGVALDAPKGLALHGDTLWVADIHALRGFDRHTGAPLATIDFAPLRAVQLNDVAIGPDGTIHVTDTGIIMGKDGVVHLGPDRIFVVGPARAITVAAEGPQLRRPNGITWDAERSRWIVVSFDPFIGEVASMPADMSSRTVIRSGKGQLDGVEVLRDGTVLFTSWADSTIHALRDGRDVPIIRDVPVAADIGVDTRRQRLAIPLSMLGRVQLWDIGGLTYDTARARP
ncbi:MAG: SMP-30/gluconolactonase/LRE family protein [Gemmatimonadaceae bacterium]